MEDIFGLLKSHESTLYTQAYLIPLKGILKTFEEKDNLINFNNRINNLKLELSDNEIKEHCKKFETIIKAHQYDSARILKIIASCAKSSLNFRKITEFDELIKSAEQKADEREKQFLSGFITYEGKKEFISRLEKGNDKDNEVDLILDEYRVGKNTYNVILEHVFLGSSPIEKNPKKYLKLLKKDGDYVQAFELALEHAELKPDKIYDKGIKFYEEKNDFVKAGKLAVIKGDNNKAIDYYTKARLFNKAAELAEKLKNPDMAIKFYEMNGDFDKAAELSYSQSNYEKAVFYWTLESMIDLRWKATEKAL